MRIVMPAFVAMVALAWAAACDAVVGTTCALVGAGVTVDASGWPFTQVSIHATWVPVCGNFACAAPPPYVGASLQVSGDVIAVHLYGSDDGLPAGATPAPTPPVGDPRATVVLVTPRLEPGTYRVETFVHAVASGVVSDLCPGPASSGDVVIDRVTGPVERRTAVEFYNAALDHWFVSTDQREITDLDLGRHAGWARTGNVFTVFAAGGSGGLGVPVCRYYGLPSFGLDSHFYSANPAECATLGTRFGGAWKLESDDVFEVRLPGGNGDCPLGFTPLYRLWNQRVDSNHRFTVDRSVVNAMQARGYLAEGWGAPPAGPTAMCVPQ